MKGVNQMSDTSIKISLKAYQELVLRKISTGVPIKVQVDRLVKVKNDTTTKITKRTK
jgi:hypothetical protein